MRVSPALVLLTLTTIATVVICGVAINQRYQAVNLEKQPGGLVFPKFHRQIDEVASIEVTRAGSQFVLIRSQDGWMNTGLGGFPARQQLVQSAIASLARLKYVEARTERSKLHHRLGVEDISADAKSTLLTIRDTSDAVLADIIVGKSKDNHPGTENSGGYIRLADDARAWLVQGSIDAHYDAPDWSARELVDIDAKLIMTLTVKHADGEVVALHRKQPQDEKLTLLNLPDGSVIEHQHQIDFMAGMLRDLNFSDAKRVGEVKPEDDFVFHVTVTSDNNPAITLYAVEPTADGSIWVRIEAHVARETQVTPQLVNGVTEAIDRINSNFDGWLVKLPRTVTNKLKIRMIDIIKPATANE